MKQQIVVSFINRACVKEARDAKRLCQIQYLFNTAVFRSGINDWTKIPWFQNAGLFGDPAQGGMPVIHGPIPPRGKTAPDGKTGVMLYRSEGAPSQHELFADRQFDVRVSFSQFKSALRMAVGSQAGKSGDKLSGADMVHGFGSGWDDPSQWVLLNASVGQEVFNTTPTREAGIGGTVTEIEVGRAE